MIMIVQYNDKVKNIIIMRFLPKHCDIKFTKYKFVNEQTRRLCPTGSKNLVEIKLWFLSLNNLQLEFVMSIISFLPCV